MGNDELAGKKTCMAEVGTLGLREAASPSIRVTAARIDLNMERQTVMCSAVPS